jgi:tRNA dimethylallyltransferase
MQLIPAIVGPTASGKSDLGIAVAIELGGEIINLDSVQVYRRIEVATAKVPLEERRGVPHHLIDIAEPTVNFTAGAWARAAASCVAQIEARGHMALLVGGSGFYLRALTDGLFESPAIETEIRDRLKRRVARVGPERLHRLLRRLDPATATRLAPNDASRVIRALEVRLATGRSLSALQAERPPAPPSRDVARRVRVVALAPPRDELYARIDLRTDRMFHSGLVDEVRGLLDEGIPRDAKALGAHGYRRVVEYLLGQRSLESAIEQTKLDTRHYAKRQMTWWRGVQGVHWIPEFGDSAAALGAALLYLRGESQ